MKKILFCFCLMLSLLKAHATNYYYNGSGVVTTLASWNTSVTGSGGSTPSNFTTSTDEFWLVNTNGTVTLTANWTITGIILHIGSGNVTMINGAYWNPTLVTTTSFSLSGTGTVKVENGGSLNLVNASVPTFATTQGASGNINFNSTSAQVITSGITYGNVSVANGTRTFGTGTTTIQGNFTVASSTTTLANAASTYTLNITGNMYISGSGAVKVANAAGASCVLNATISGDLICTSTAATEIQWHSNTGTSPSAVIVVNGNVSDNTPRAGDGNFIDWGNASNLGPNSYLGIKGNLTLQGKNRFYLAGNNSAKGIVFMGTGTEANPQIINWNMTSSLVVSNGYCNYYVNSGTYVLLRSRLIMGTNTGSANWQNIFKVLSGGTLAFNDTSYISDGNSNGSNGFSVDPGGNLVTSNPSGFNGSITAVRSTAVGLSSGANYRFNGRNPQVTGTLMPASVNNITISDTNTYVTLSQNTTTGTLQFTGGKLRTSGSTLTVTSTVTGTSSSCYVDTRGSGSRLIKPITGLTTLNYEIGDSTYAPVQLDLQSAGTAGSIGMQARYGFHPNFSTANLSGSAYVTHYWTPTTISVTGPSRLNAKFSYPVSGDIIGGDNSAFIAKRYVSSWNTPGIAVNSSSPIFSKLDTLLVSGFSGDYQFGNYSPTPVTYYCKSTGFLNNLATWGTNTDGTGTAPTDFSNTGDSFIIKNNPNPTLNGTWNLGISTIIVGDTTVQVHCIIPASYPITGSATMYVKAGDTLTIRGNTLPILGNAHATSTIIFNTTGTISIPTITYGNLIFNGVAGNHQVGTTTILSSYRIQSGSITIPLSATVTSSGINMADSTTLTINNNTLPTLGSLAATSTIILNTTSAITLPTNNYGNIIYNGTNTITLSSGTTNVLGNFTATSGTLQMANSVATYNINITGDLNLNGSAAMKMAVGSATTTSCNINVQIYGSLNSTSTASPEIRWIDISSVAVAPNAKMQVYGNVYDSTYRSTDGNYIDWGVFGSYSANSYLAVKGNVTMLGKNKNYLLGDYDCKGMVFNGVGSASAPQILTVRQTSANALTGTSVYNNITVDSLSYVYLNSSYVMGISFSATFDWQNIFKVKNGGTLALGPNAVISLGNNNRTNGFQVEAGGVLLTEHPLGFNPGITCSLTTATGLSTSANYGFIGNAGQITGTLIPATVNKLIINDSANVTLSRSVLCNTLQFLAGKLKTDIYNVTVNNSVTGAGTNKYVCANNTAGALRKPITGLTSLLFEVGDTSYAPVNITLSAAGTAGSIGVQSRYGAHPNFVTSSISNDHFCKHYWTLYNQSAAGFLRLVPKFNYNLSDVEGLGERDSFIVRKYASSAWSACGAATNDTVGNSVTLNSGLPLASFTGDFQFGDTSTPHYTYYAKATGYLNDLSTWGMNTDGTGIAPLSFDNLGDSFIVVNNTAPTLNASWPITFVTVIIGNGTTNVNFNVPSAYNITGTGIVTVLDNSTLTLNNASLPNLGTFSNNSTLVLNGSASIALPAMNFGNVTVNGSNLTHAAGTTLINGTYRILAGNVLIPSTATVTNSGIRLSGTSSLEVATTTIPNLGTVGDSSTLIVSGTGNISLPARSYGNVTYTGVGTLVHSVGTTSINGNYNATTGKIVLASSAATYTVNVAKDVNISGTASLLMSSVGSASCTAQLNIQGNLNTSGTATSMGTGVTSQAVINYQSNTGAPSVCGIQVNGNVNNTAATYNYIDWGTPNANSTNYLGIKGDFNIGGSGRFYFLGNYQATGVVFNGTAPQVLSYTSTYAGAGSGIQYCNFTVNSGAYVRIADGTNLPLGTSTAQTSIFQVLNGGTLDLDTTGVISGGTTGGGFRLNSGATLKTANVGGVSAGITATINSTIGFAAGAKYHFYGSTNSPFPAAITTAAPNTVTIDTAILVQANYNIAPSTALYVQSGAILDMVNNTLSGAFTPYITGAIKTQSTANPPIPSGRTWGGVVEFNNTSGGQSLPAGTYNKIINSNTSGINSLVASSTLNVSTLELVSSSKLNDNGNNLIVSGNITGAGTHQGTGFIEMTGASATIAQDTIGNLKLNNAAGFSLAGSPRINGNLQLVSGRLSLQNKDLYLGTTATITGTFDGSKMIVADSTGQIHKFVGSLSTFTYPLGDRTGSYSPISITYAGSLVGVPKTMVSVKKAKHPNNANVSNFINRYWQIQQSNSTGLTYSISATYNNADVTGMESNLSTGKYRGSLPWTKYLTVDTVNNVLTASSISDSVFDISGITAANPVLSLTSSADTICIGTTVNYSASTVGDSSFTYSWIGTSLSASTGRSVTCTPSSAGTYTTKVTVTDANGFKDSITRTLIVLGVPSLTIGANPVICQPASTANINISGISGGANRYSITYDSVALAAGFTNVSRAILGSSFITLSIPASRVGTYYGTIIVHNPSCNSSTYNFNVTILAHPNAAITSVSQPCMHHNGIVQFTGTPSASISYTVDGGAMINTTLTGGTYTLNLTAVTDTHSYRLIEVYNVACSETIDTTVIVAPVPMKWLGGASGAESDWNTASNWTCGIAPTVVDYVHIQAGASYAPQISSVLAPRVHDLTIDASALLIIDSLGSLSLKGDLHNNGSVLGAGKLVMNDSVTRTLYGQGIVKNLNINSTAAVVVDTNAKIIIKGNLTMSSGTFYTSDSVVLYADSLGSAKISTITGGAIVGDITMMQYIPGGRRAYRFVAHPFSHAISMLQWQQYIDITGSGGAAQGFVPTGSNAPSAFRYQPLVGNSSLGSDPGWRPFTSINTVADSCQMNEYQGVRLFVRGSKGQGLSYTTYIPNPVTVYLKGAPNQGTQTIHLAKGSSANQDYNMVGNPYASPVDIGTIAYNAKVSGNIVGAAYYIWNPYLATVGQFQAVPVNTTSATPYYVQANAAFQVRAAHNNDSLVFNESNKGNAATTNILRMSTEGVSLHVYDEKYHLWDMMQLSFNDEAASALDNDFDALKPMGPEFNFYSLSTDDRALAIDGRMYDAHKRIPLGIKSNYLQKFIVKASAVRTPDNSEVYLHDKYLNVYHHLAEGSEYAFEVTKDKQSQGDERFELSFRAKGDVPMQGLEMALLPNPTEGDVQLVFESAEAGDVHIRVLDVRGVQVIERSLGRMTASTVQLPTATLASGIYMVEFTCGTNKITKKLIKQ